MSVKYITKDVYSGRVIKVTYRWDAWERFKERVGKVWIGIKLFFLESPYKNL